MVDYDEDRARDFDAYNYQDHGVRMNAIHDVEDDRGCEPSDDFDGATSPVIDLVMVWGKGDE